MQLMQKLKMLLYFLEMKSALIFKFITNTFNCFYVLIIYFFAQFTYVDVHQLFYHQYNIFNPHTFSKISCLVNTLPGFEVSNNNNLNSFLANSTCKFLYKTVCFSLFIIISPRSLIYWRNHLKHFSS